MAVKNSLVKSGRRLGFTAYLTQDAVKNRINEVVGGKDGQRFISAIVSAVTINPTLQECSHATILSAALLGESLKLSPSPQLGQYYLVPFNDKNKGKVAQFQMGYKGYIQLAIRSGKYKKLNVQAVKEGELISYDPFNEEIEVAPIKDPDIRESAETVGYYAMLETVEGFKKSLYWSKRRMEEHAKRYSQGYANDLKKGTAWTFWSKDFDAMAYKTMLRQLISKWGPMSIDSNPGMTDALSKDMSVINEDGTYEYVDNEEYAADPEDPEEEKETSAPNSDAVLEPGDDISAALFGGN